uniref:hypothetical protein n=1 Tax=Roseivirga sp. TaxID=1964215 RepID=UPI0040480618
MAKSFNNLRVGKKFRFTNFGETFEFQVMEIMADGDCKLRDIHTLEAYNLFDFTRYGLGSDFDVLEVNS